MELTSAIAACTLESLIALMPPPTATPASTAPTATVAVASISDVATPLASLIQFTKCLKVLITSSQPFNSLFAEFVARGQPNGKLLKNRASEGVAFEESTKSVICLKRCLQ